MKLSLSDVACFRRCYVRFGASGAGGFYDYLGRSSSAPRLDPGQGFHGDPSYFFSPLIVGPTAGSLDLGSRLAWSSYAESFYDSSAVTLRYNGIVGLGLIIFLFVCWWGEGLFTAPCSNTLSLFHTQAPNVLV